MNQDLSYSRGVSRSEVTARFMSKVYQWMSLGIGITAFVSYEMSQNPDLIYTLMANRFLFWGLVIAQLGLVFTLSGMIHKLSSSMASLIFLGYSALTGITLSSIFLVYSISSIQSAFFTTSLSFLGLSAFGYITKKDLGPIGSFCTMGLFGLVGFSLLSLIFPSMMGPISSKVSSMVGLLVFAGLTAYDTQAIKSMSESGRFGSEGSEGEKKSAICGALKLYLDFINLFLFILRFMGGDRRR